MTKETYVIWNKFNNEVLAIVKATGEREIKVIKGDIVFKKNEVYKLNDEVGATTINRLFQYMNNYDDINSATCLKSIWYTKYKLGR